MTGLAEIVKAFGGAYRERYGSRMPWRQVRALSDIAACRTPALGGQEYVCRTCSASRYSYHSCRNRHCPNCHTDQAPCWLDAQTALLLPVPRFLITYTVPEALRALIRSHEGILLQILFQASAEALRTLSRDARFVGGKIGMTGVLHTWTRKLEFHPHIQYLVPAGGLLGETWRPARKEGFLVPVKALSVIFRAKFRDALRRKAPELFASVPNGVWSEGWVVHSKAVGTGAGT